MNKIYRGDLNVAEESVKTSRIKLLVSVNLVILIAITALTMFFTWREYRLNREFTERAYIIRLNHLAESAEQSLGFDELALISAIKSLEADGSIQYAFILNNDREAIQYFDREGRHPYGKVPAVFENRDVTASGETVRVTQMADPRTGNKIREFAQPVFNRFTRERMATVVMGVSDTYTRVELMEMFYAILPIYFISLFFAMAAASLLAARFTDE